MAGLLKGMPKVPAATGVAIRNAIYDNFMKRTSVYVGVILVGAMGCQQIGDTSSQMVWDMHNTGVRAPPPPPPFLPRPPGLPRRHSCRRGALSVCCIFCCFAPLRCLSAPPSGLRANSRGAARCFDALLCDHCACRCSCPPPSPLQLGAVTIRPTLTWPVCSCSNDSRT